MTGQPDAPAKTANELALERTTLADDRTDLAVERTLMALDRTLMAWVRTATSLISFGFTIYKFFEFDSGRGSIPPASSRLLTPRHFGMIMIAT